MLGVHQSLPWELILSFKTLLVLLDESEDSLKRLDVVCSLADHHRAYLNALAMSHLITPYMAAGLGGGAGTIHIELIEEAKELAQSIATAAKKSMDARGQVGDVRWASHPTFGLREAAALEGRHADLVIAGQPIEDQTIGLREAAFEGALLSSGRPVLLAPSNWQGPVNMRNLVVAWDASKEATRALADAAPFIEQAEKITIVIVDPEPSHQGFGENPGADIAPVLARHCDKVELDRIPSSGASVAQALLARTKDASGDLIIMGGYGHSLLSESFFGGVTREIIHRTTTPLLMSH